MFLKSSLLLYSIIETLPEAHQIVSSVRKVEQQEQLFIKTKILTESLRSHILKSINGVFKALGLEVKLLGAHDEAGQLGPDELDLLFAVLLHHPQLLV